MKIMRCVLLLPVTALVLSNSTIVANPPGFDELPASAQALLNQFDGVQVYWSEVEHEGVLRDPHDSGKDSRRRRKRG